MRTCTGWKRSIGITMAVGLGLTLGTPALAATPPIEVNTGDTAWLLASSALVLLMTPALALFYGGMVRTKNVLGTNGTSGIRQRTRHIPASGGSSDGDRNVVTVQTRWPQWLSKPTPS